MTTYIYETLTKASETPERFEIFQRMSEAPLLTHPENGKPIK